jgi:two-component system nitrate/nitrite response regulator NarL
VRLVLCDDHRLFVEPLAAALEMRGHDVRVVTSPHAAIQAVEDGGADLCVADLRFPDGSGLQIVAALRRRQPPCPVVILSGSAEGGDIAAAMAAGAMGFLRKDQPVSAVFDALDRIAAGRSVAAGVIPRSPAASGPDVAVRRLVDRLTQREREVLHRLVWAEDTVGIARSLGVAPSTARTHLQNVLLKLGVHSRLEAVALVVGAGMDGEL